MKMLFLVVVLASTVLAADKVCPTPAVFAEPCHAEVPTTVPYTWKGADKHPMVITRAWDGQSWTTVSSESHLAPDCAEWHALHPNSPEDAKDSFCWITVDKPHPNPQETEDEKKAREQAQAVYVAAQAAAATRAARADDSERHAEEKAAKKRAEEDAQRSRACHTLYVLTVDKKISDLTVGQKQVIDGCISLGLYQ